MTLYMHVILFFICLNFGLGITTIPDTPLTLVAPIDPATNLPRADMDCFHSFQSQALIIPVYDANGAFVEWTTHTGVGVPNLGVFYDGAGNPIAESTFTANATGGYNAITQAIEGSYAAGETLKGIFLGGYITGILGSMSMQCDTELGSDTYGTAVVSPVMSYITYFINVIFGIMILLALIYLVTGKSFGF